MLDIKNKVYPLVPLRDVVIFPKMIMPLFVGRNKSVKAIDIAEINASLIVLVAQKDSSADAPKKKDIYSVGILAKVLQTLKLPDGTLKVLVEAKGAVRIKAVNESERNDYLEASIQKINIKSDCSDIERGALLNAVLEGFQEYSKYNIKLNSEMIGVIENIKDPNNLVDMIVVNMNLAIEKKQAFLEIDSVKDKLKKILVELKYETEILKVERKIQEDVKKQMEKAQKDYFLNEQLKAIHKELGDVKEGKGELTEIEEKIKTLRLSKEALEKAQAELSKLKLMSPISAEATILRNYLDALLSLPWNKCTRLKHDVKRAEQILDRDHHGLQKVKDRILEFLSVQKRTKSIKGPILCFVGPPGVGKTSLAKSIAEAMGRNFVKFSLGGIRDEAEIRGHRKTYLGSMPGKILYLVRKAKSSNPVMLLDEIDKVGSDYRGDPANALLEVLDPEQNTKFVDHYLEVEYDLSKVMFIATANSTDIHPALLDRMEIIRISGYTEDEKLMIATKHLLRKQCKEHKLTRKEFNVSDIAILDMIRYYTHEAGVRNLERELAKLARKAVREIERDKTELINVTPDNLNKYLGVRKYQYGETEKTDLVGVTIGLAYTEVGGDLLAIEAVLVPGDGKIKTTGKLGEVMQESAQAAFSYFCSNADQYNIDLEEYAKKDIHLHVPEGAIPKDGPSAGIAMFTSIVSVMLNIPVKKTIAMTGEITLRGRVLPIGGLKEKLLAAHRGGIKTVLIPAENEKDLVDIPKNVTKNLEITPVNTANDVIKCALTTTLSSEKIAKEGVIERISTENCQKEIITH